MASETSSAREEIQPPGGVVRPKDLSEGAQISQQKRLDPRRSVQMAKETPIDYWWRKNVATSTAR